MTGLMAGKRGLIMGLANDKSLAWGIAKKLAEAGRGAGLLLSGRGDGEARRPARRAARLATSCSTATSPKWAALDHAFATLKQRWQTIDFVVHAIGFSDKNELRGKYVDTSLDNFLMTMNISAYSFVAVARRARRDDAGRRRLLTLVLLRRREGDPALQRDGGRQGGAGDERQVSRDGPRAGEYPGQRHLGRPDQDAGGERHRRLPLHHEWNELNSPLRRNVTIEDVGGAGLYLLVRPGRAA